LEYQRKNRIQRIASTYGGEDTSSLDVGETSPRDDGNDGINKGDDDEDDDDESDSYDPQRVTVPLTLCLAIMVG